MNRFESITTQPLTWLMALLLAAFVAGCGDGNGTPVVSSKPTVSSTVPLNLATGVALNSNITATFSEAMKSSTITDVTFTLKQGSTPVLGVVSYVGVVATFNPTSNLAASTNYTATVSTGVKDMAGNALALAKTWSFTTGTTTDTAAPTVNSTVPANTGTGAINANITATFSEPMDPLTITATTFTLKQGNTPVSGAVTSVGNIATFNPDANLTASTPYTATITGGIAGVMDLAGNPLAADEVWSFTTSAAADSAAPNVSLTDPLNGASGVVISSNITATFDEPMDPLTITATTFTLETGAASAVAGAVLTPTTTTATFNPDFDLAAGTAYTAKITTGAKDLASNPLAVTKTWSFTTAGGGGGPGTLTLTANAPIITEPAAAGTKAMTFVLTLGSAPVTPVTVTYATQITGTAASGSDFVAATGTVNFATGQAVATLSITANGDAATETDETVPVLFSGADLVADVTGTGTILANDTTGNTVVLTAGLDNFTPTVSSYGATFSTANDDTVNTNGPTQLTSIDTIATGAGFDTLSITPTTNVAYTLDDAIFTNVSGIDKIFLLDTGTGAQTITTGVLFNAAFDAAGVDLQTTSTTGAQTIDMSAVTGAATLTSISDANVTGNSITMGAGVTTVTATSTTGAMTINSATSVVATVTATTTFGAVTVTTGAGADSVTLTTGDTAGNVITTGAGNDTIDATATTATTTGSIITGGLGADTIILTGNTSKDTIVIADGDTGITVATADSITGFTAADDNLSMSLAAGANYVEAVAPVTDFAAALTAANSALDGPGGIVRYSFQFDGTNGYLFKDTNADGNADQVVVLVGITDAGIAAANIP